MLKRKKRVKPRIQRKFKNNNYNKKKKKELLKIRLRNLVNLKLKNLIKKMRIINNKQLY